MRIQVQTHGLSSAGSFSSSSRRASPEGSWLPILVPFPSTHYQSLNPAHKQQGGDFTRMGTPEGRPQDRLGGWSAFLVYFLFYLSALRSHHLLVRAIAYVQPSAHCPVRAAWDGTLQRLAQSPLSREVSRVHPRGSLKRSVAREQGTRSCLLKNHR